MTNLTYTVNWPDVDDEHVTFQTRHEAVAFFVDEGAPREAVQEALTRAEDYGHNECRLSGGRVYIWTEDKPGARQIVQTGVVTEDFGSTMTHVNHVDTYSAFPLGETEYHGDDGLEYQQLGSLIANALDLDFDGDFDDLPDDVTSAWVDRGPWGRWHEDGNLWEVTYDHAGWVAELATASVAVLQDNVVDPAGIVRAVDFTGESWSPQYYNFSTDGYMARWTVDTDALEAWLTDHDIVIGDGRGISGFMRTADDEAWYLARALQEYLEHEIGDRYFDDMLGYLSGNGVEDQYVDVTLTDAGRAWLAEYTARATK